MPDETCNLNSRLCKASVDNDYKNWKTVNNDSKQYSPNSVDINCTESEDRNFILFGSKKGPHIGCLNIQHILPRCVEIKLFFTHAFPSLDIFGFCKTVLSDYVSDSYSNINKHYQKKMIMRFIEWKNK